MKNRSNAFCNTVLALCSVSAQAGIDVYQPGIRAMSMGGAFVAQADDSSALWYNPAGLSQFAQGEESHGDIGFQVGQYETDVSEDVSHPYGILVGAGMDSGMSGWALGVYDTGRMNVAITETASGDVYPATVEHGEWALGYGWRLSKLEMGFALNLVAAGISGGPGRIEENPSGFSGKLGVRYALVDSALDFWNTSAWFSLAAGAVYRSEGKVDFNPEYSRARYNQLKTSVTPETLAYGLHTHVGWATEWFAWKLALNAELESSTYSDMSQLWQLAVDNRDVEFERQRLGAEWLVMPGDNTWGVALRAGLTRQTANFAELDGMTYAAGLGIRYKSVTLDLAAQQYRPEGADEAGDPVYMAGLSVSF